jgi:hypothetical protein
MGPDPTRIVRRENTYAEVAALNEQPGREILIFGSHVLWNDLLANGFVDRLHFMIGAGVVGEGSAFSRPGRRARSACWTPALLQAPACSWPATPSNAYGRLVALLNSGVRQPRSTARGYSKQASSACGSVPIQIPGPGISTKRPVGNSYAYCRMGRQCMSGTHRDDHNDNPDPSRSRSLR